MYMNIPRPAYHGFPQEQSLLTVFTLMRLEAERGDEPAHDPEKKQPEPQQPQREIPVLPKTPESIKPSMPELGPVVEIPPLPKAPETGISV